MSLASHWKIDQVASGKPVLVKYGRIPSGPGAGPIGDTDGAWDLL